MFQLIIDELYIYEHERGKIREGERSDFAELLEYLREKCEKNVIVLSSTTSSDSSHRPGDISSDHLYGMIQSLGYKAVTLDKVMRNTSSITNSVSDNSWNSFKGRIAGINDISLCISRGHCSTVTGSKPTAIFYKESDEGDYSVLGHCVQMYLDGNPHIRDTRLAILCDSEISARRLNPEISSLFPDMKWYDAGIEEFDGVNSPKFNLPEYYGYTENYGEAAVIRWLEEGGTLLTHAYMFRGCEAESVIVVCKDWGTIAGYNPRSSATRGVANLCIITGDSALKPEEMQQHFTVIKATATSTTEQAERDGLVLAGGSASSSDEDADSEAQAGHHFFHVLRLTEMGFDHSQAEAALTACSGDFDRALDYLLAFTIKSDTAVCKLILDTSAVDESPPPDMAGENRPLSASSSDSTPSVVTTVPEMTLEERKHELARFQTCMLTPAQIKEFEMLYERKEFLVQNRHYQAAFMEC